MCQGKVMRIAAAATLIPLTAACTLLNPSAGPLEVEITEVAIQPPPAGGALVMFSVTNMTSASVWLARCGDAVIAAVDHAVGPGWDQYSGGACLHIYDMSPSELEAGATVSSARSILNSGTYRLRVGFREEPAGKVSWDAMSDWFKVSGI